MEKIAVTFLHNETARSPDRCQFTLNCQISLKISSSSRYMNERLISMLFDVMGMH
jgi:hypothetical protein